MIHHIAIGTHRLQEMTDFYRSLPGLVFREWQFRDDGLPRSAWFDCGETILMLEEGDRSGLRALVFVWHEEWHEELIGRATESTRYTLYLLDPDGNRLGYSRYPVTLPGV